jgi:hypothetical protein
MARAGEIIREFDTLGVGQVNLAGTQSLTNDVETVIQYNTIIRNNPDMWDETNFRFIIPPGMSGLYSLAAGISFNPNATGHRWLRLNVNSDRIIQSLTAASQSGVTRLNVGTQTFLQEGDTIQGVAEQTSGGALSIAGNTSGISFIEVNFIRQMTFGIDND